MKVLALTYYDRLGASSRLRFFQYLPYLNSYGVEVEVSFFLSSRYVELRQGGSGYWREAWKSLPMRLLKLLKKKDYDLLWIEKECVPLLPAFLETRLLGDLPPFVLDYDDAVFHRYDQHSNPLLRYWLGDKYSCLMRRSALVITGNHYLETYARLHGARNIAQLPTVIDLSRYTTFRQVQSLCDSVRVGWIGQTSTAKFLVPLANVFREFEHEGVATFKAIGIDPKTHGLTIEGVVWSEETEVESIKNLDIGIMPLTNTPFERGKCGYKLIQYMGCGLPVVASPVGVNTEIIEHGVNGFLVETETEWFDALRALINDAALRERMGSAGRLKVERHYNILVTAPKLAELLKQAASGLRL